MRKYIPETVCSLGVAMLVGGVMIFVAGILGSGISFGGLYYARTHVCIFGSVLSAIGSGSIVFGILLIRGRTNSN